MMVRRPHLAAALLLALAGTACQKGRDVCQEFPASVGFEPLEPVADLEFPAPVDATPDSGAIVTSAGPLVSHAWAHAKATLNAPLGRVYAVLKRPAASRIHSPGGNWTPTVGVEPYPISHDIEYLVRTLIDVKWTIRTRGGVVSGTEADPQAIGLRYQKTCGDDHIAVESGSLVAVPDPADPARTRLEMVGWLIATTQGPEDVRGTMLDWWGNILAELPAP